MKGLPLTAFIFLIFTLMPGCTSAPDQDAAEPTEQTGFDEAVITGTVTDPLLAEASGIAASAGNPGHFWVIVDGGNAAALFLIDSTGDLKSKIPLKEMKNTDWEDIVLIKNSKTSSNQLIVADIGDNQGKRSYIQLIVMDEPVDSILETGQISAFQLHKYVYPDSARDAQAILSDPLNNELYIISKREANAGLYRVPASTGDRKLDTLALVGRLPFGNVTAGSISADGTGILIKTYSAIYFWPRKERTSLTEVVQRPHLPVRYTLEPQGEAICWNLDGSGFYTLSEKSFSDKQYLYYYSKKQK